MNNQENNQDPDQEFAKLQKERNCLHLKEKFYKQFSKKKLPHLDKNTQQFFYQQIIKHGANKCLCECLNSLRKVKENRYYQLSQSQQAEIKELKLKLKQLARTKNQTNKNLIKIKELLEKCK